MYKSCSKCGKIHKSKYRCHAIKRIVYQGGNERKLRSTWKWTEKSREIRERAHYLCEVCKDKGRITYEGIEVHHIIKVKDDESLLLDNNNLICLCTAHHKQADNNQLDINYLKDLAQQREEQK